MDLLMKRRQMIQSTPTSNVIPYIRNTDTTAYIDTGITPDNTTKVIVGARNFNQGGKSNNGLFGSRIAYQNSMFDLPLGNDKSVGAICACYGNAGLVGTYDAGKYCSWYHKYEVSSNGLYVDDSRIATVTSATFSSNLNIHLFGLNSGGSHTNSSCPIDICACKIYKNDVLVRDFSAVNYPDVGLYDSVSDTLFTNAGSGNFTYGTFDPDAYIPLTYIEGTADQYFDTGAYGKGDMSVVSRFKIIGTAQSYPDLFGTMRQGISGTYFLLEFGSASYKNRYANFYINTTTGNQIYNNNNSKLTNKDVVFIKSNVDCKLVYNKALTGTTKTFSVDPDGTTPDTIYLGTLKNNNDTPNYGNKFTGYIYYARFGNERNFVPAKVNHINGMYDTYNDVFYGSESGTPFLGSTYVKSKPETIGNYQLVRYGDAENYESNGIGYDDVYNQRGTLTSSTYNNVYHEFLNSSTTSASSYGTLTDVLPSLGYHGKMTVDVAIKHNPSANQYILDFGSVQSTTDNTQAFAIGLNKNKKGTFNTKFNGNDSASTYNVDTSNLQESISDGDGIRRTITIGVRASEIEGDDETFVDIENLGSGVSTPFTPINFNNGMSGCYIGRSATVPNSTYPYASSVRIYSIKVYKETT